MDIRWLWCVRTGWVIVSLIGSAATEACQSVPCTNPKRVINPFELHTATDGLPLLLDEEAIAPHDTSAQDTFVVLEYGRTDKTDTSDEVGYSAQAAGLTIGRLWSLDEARLLGLSASHEKTRTTGNDGLSQTNNQFTQFDLMLASQKNDWRISGSASLAYAHDRAWRQVSQQDARIGLSHVNSYYALASTALARRFAQDDWQIETGLSVAVIYQYTPSYQEHGLGSDNLHIQSSHDVKVMFSPSIAFSRKLTVNRFELAYYLSSGLIFLPDHRWTTRATTQGSPGKVMRDYATLPSIIGDLQAGVQLSGNGQWSLNAEYSLQIARGYRGQSGSVRATLRF